MYVPVAYMRKGGEQLGQAVYSDYTDRAAHDMEMESFTASVRTSLSCAHGAEVAEHQCR